MSKGGKSKTQETTNQVTSQTTTPNAPSWYTSGLQNLGSQIDAFGASDASQYVAPASPLQQQAFSKAGEMQTSPLFGQAAEMAGNTSYTPAMQSAPQLGSAATVEAQSLLTGLEDYINPYQSQVTDAYTADFDETAGQTRAAQSAQAALNGAFGGSRYGIREAQTEGELSRARASGLGGILQQGFDRATSLSADDANRRQSAGTFNASAENQFAMQQAAFDAAMADANQSASNQASQFGISAGLQGAGLLGDLGNSQMANERANIGLLGDLGGVQQGIDANQRTAGLSQLQALAQLYGGLPTQGLIGTQSNGTMSGTGTSTQSQTPGAFQQIGQGVQTAASLAALFCDARLKENIVYRGEENGHRVYSYNYVWSDEPEIGVIAQEIMATRPEAVMAGPGGFLMVDYGRL